MKIPAVLIPLLFAAAALSSGEIKMDKYSMFDKGGFLHFNYKADELAPREAAARIRLEEDLKKIIDIPKGERTFENTLLAYDDAFENYSRSLGQAGFLAYVSDDDKLREAALALEQEISKYMVEVATRRDIYQAFKDYNDTKPRLGETEAKMLRDAMIGFRKSGLMLDDKKLEKFKELNKKMAENSINFSKNIREYKDQLAVSGAQLKGLPPDYTEKLKRDADGKYIITLDYPDYTPFMLNAEDEEARKELEFKFSRRGGPENIKLLEENLYLRGQAARLLGYKNHAESRLDTRMAKTPEKVISFLKDLQKKLKPMAHAEDKELLRLKLEKTGIKTKNLAAWESGYWNNLHKKLYYDVDQEKIKEYFQADIVIAGMFNIFGNLFGVEFEPAKIPVWHKDVKTYAVKDTESQKILAYIYMDLYPRAGKYKHAACFGLVEGKQNKDGSYQKPFTAIVANFNPPAGGRPSLLNHGEVETLFHEFGHVLHNVLTEAKYAAVSGTAVARDFVEAPSQLLENWAWHPKVLKQISRHYKTGLPLDDAMIQKMLAAKNHGSGNFYIRQDFLAQIDMKYHTRNRRQNTTEEWAAAKLKITAAPMTKGTYPQASFDHIMSGYDAGYYGYLWSEVIAQDFFGEFEKHGIFDADTGKKYRKAILAAGGSYDEEKLVENFLGRKIDNGPFLKSIGLK
ncbi:MAG: Zn-dependent oligopeptidase [Elusimicrobiota bacterium]|jgi:thimet oligopeptidase|nr:Zn-dependent oligopeptidase [Elusimicrobiota bacterium]